MLQYDIKVCELFVALVTTNMFSIAGNAYLDYIRNIADVECR